MAQVADLPAEQSTLRWLEFEAMLPEAMQHFEMLEVAVEIWRVYDHIIQIDEQVIVDLLA